MTSRPARRSRSSVPSSRRRRSGVSRTRLSSKTRRRCTRNPALRSRRLASATPATESLISVSMGGVAFMMVEKILVDRLAPAEAFFYAVPEFDSSFAEPPAQVDFDTAEGGRKIDQPCIQILYEAPDLLDVFERGL